MSQHPTPSGDTGEVLGIVLVIFFILLLVFLFEGDPDVWDMLRLRAMEYLKP